MEIIVLSRNEIKEFLTEKKHIVISIRDPNGKKVQLSEQRSRLDILFLAFHDLDKPLDGFDKLYSHEDAKQVWNFIQRYKNEVRLIVVQCEAGISRSAGIAAACRETHAQLADFTVLGTIDSQYTGFASVSDDDFEIIRKYQAKVG